METREQLINRRVEEVRQQRADYLYERKAYKFYSIFKVREGPREIIFKYKQRSTDLKYRNRLYLSIDKCVQYRTFLNYNRQNQMLIHIENKKHLYTLVRSYFVLSKKYNKHNKLKHKKGEESAFGAITKFDRSKADFSKGIYFGVKLARDPNVVDTIIEHKTLLDLKKHYMKIYTAGCLQ